MAMAYLIIAVLFCISSARAQVLEPVPQGFPEIWNGDKYKQAKCRIIQSPPSWVDGFLFAQTSGSWGNPANPDGEKLYHMYDAIPGLSLYEISPKKAAFTGSYYPSKGYKIWEYYDRDMSKSKVAWSTFYSNVDVQAWRDWSRVKSDYSDTDIDKPNIDFWKIGKDIVAATESWNLGLKFDIESGSNFHQYQFTESDKTLIGRNGETYTPVHMPMHEGVDPGTGLIWHTVLAMKNATGARTFHQLIFTVERTGLRTVQAIYDFSPVNMSLCSEDGYTYTGPYTGNNLTFPRLMHTVSNSDNFLVLPMSSAILNPCNWTYIPTNASTKFDPMRSFAFQWKPDAPALFLIYNKRSKEFVKFEYPEPLFFTHQWNSYQESNDAEKIYTDLIVFDRFAYDLLSPNELLKTDDRSARENYAMRYTLDLNTRRVFNRSLLPNESTKLEFPQINRNFEGKPYKYGYALYDLGLAPNYLIKIDMHDPSGGKNKIFKPKRGKCSFSEPYFVPRPGGTDEEDGVVVARALDVTTNRTRIFFLDAKNFTQVGEVESPYFTPFGLHERFYTRQALEMQPRKSEFLNIYPR